MDLGPYLKLMAARGASDLFLSPGAPAHIKVDGHTRPVGTTPLTPAAIRQLTQGALSRDQGRAFARTLELNVALSLPGAGRFRINVYRTRGETAMAVRRVPEAAPSIEALGLPVMLKDLALEPRGLILAAGAAGAGKTTTAAAMIDHRCRHRHGHILTVEDPIEFVHRHRLSLVDQREVGLDTLSYASALKSALREAPDVILIGEIRDRPTMEQALAYAETGHLCLSTLHAANASQTLDRIVDFFPPEAHRRVRAGLSLNLRAVISQRLVRDINGSRRPAVELLLHSPRVAQLIADGDSDGLRTAMARGDAVGMRTFDQTLYGLYREGAISAEEALANADARHDLKLRIRLTAGKGSDWNIQGRKGKHQRLAE